MSLLLVSYWSSCHGKTEECIGLCRALLAVVVWLLQGCAWYCEKLRELGPSASTETSLGACQERLQSLMTSTKNRALVHIARLEDQGIEVCVGICLHTGLCSVKSGCNLLMYQYNSVYITRGSINMLSKVYWQFIYLLILSNSKANTCICVESGNWQNYWQSAIVIQKFHLS